MTPAEPVECAVAFARALFDARKLRRDWSVRQLAERIEGLGFDGPDEDRLRQLEAGGKEKPTAATRQRLENVRLREVIACAAALGVAPVSLLAPIDEENGPSVKWGRGDLAPRVFRDWLAGGNIKDVSPDASDHVLYHSFQPQRILDALAKRAPDFKVAGQTPPLAVRVAQMPKEDLQQAWAAGTAIYDPSKYPEGGSR
jgi:hypothetical protein